MDTLAQSLVRVAHRPPPTCLRALSLQRMLTVCMLVRCRSLARMELRQARRHVEHGRASAILRSSSTASSFVAAGAQSPNRVSAALLVCMVLPACESTPDTCLLHLLRCKWVEGGGDGGRGAERFGRWTGVFDVRRVDRAFVLDR